MAEPLELLIIDDSEDDLDLYRRLLLAHENAYVIRTAETGTDGIELYQNARADCVLLDYHLPGHDGIDVLQLLKKTDPYATVVMLTGQGSEDIAVAAMKAGAVDYVVKDTVTADVLRRAITNAVEKASLHQKLVTQQLEQERFIRTLVHDVRAPLRNVDTFAGFLGEDLRAGQYDEVQEHLDAIQQSVRRIADLVETLAAYALLEGEITFEPVDVEEIYRTACTNLEQIIKERGVQLSSAALPTVIGHAPQLTQVFQNLMANAIKFTDGRTPEIAVSARRQDENFWLIEVADNGIGIPQDRLTYVFEPFKRLWSQDRFEGSGLGLSICKKIVERHGGQIWCESEEGKGTRFRFTLRDASA